MAEQNVRINVDFTIHEGNGVNFLLDAQNNGINSVSIDLPNMALGNPETNHDTRNGRPYFTALFSPNALGTHGDAPRRPFYGPGINNWDLALHKVTRLSESESLELRFETFNTFNDTQFDGYGSVDGNINDATFGEVVRSAPLGTGCSPALAGGGCHLHPLACGLHDRHRGS